MKRVVTNTRYRRKSNLDKYIYIFKITLLIVVVGLTARANAIHHRVRIIISYYYLRLCVRCARAHAAGRKRTVRSSFGYDFVGDTRYDILSRF